MSTSSAWAGRRALFVLCNFELGGAERQALHVARHLKSLGCDVRVWAHHHERRGTERVIELCAAAGIPWEVYRFRWPCRKVDLLRDTWRLWRGLRQAAPDLVLPYTPWPSIGCGLVWPWSPAKVCVWGQRDVDDLRPDCITRLAYRRSSAAISNSAHAADYLRRCFPTTAKPVHVVPNGVDLEPPEKSRAAWRHEWGIAPQDFVATMLANFRPQKDHAILLRAWAEFVDSFPAAAARPHLLLAGSHQESYPSVRQLADTLGLGERVHFLGAVKDVSGLLHASDLGMLCTHHEGLPNAILEYMTCGLPVAGTDVPGNREALGDGADAQLYRSGDVHALTTLLRTLAHDSVLRLSLGARNRQRAVEVYSLTQMCERMTSIADELLSASSSSERTGHTRR